MEVTISVSSKESCNQKTPGEGGEEAERGSPQHSGLEAWPSASRVPPEGWGCLGSGGGELGGNGSDWKCPPPHPREVHQGSPAWQGVAPLQRPGRKPPTAVGGQTSLPSDPHTAAKEQGSPSSLRLWRPGGVNWFFQWVEPSLLEVCCRGWASGCREGLLPVGSIPPPVSIVKPLLEPQAAAPQLPSSEPPGASPALQGRGPLSSLPPPPPGLAKGCQSCSEGGPAFLSFVLWGSYPKSGQSAEHGPRS